ncbi:hypothetical protein C4577_01845 [Candidatus Parcubacteria bacterium]|nr:MAG: hypothetical protein C4577_01845 [Candidatus Parcubacteria bacterium]
MRKDKAVQKYMLVTFHTGNDVTCLGEYKIFGIYDSLEEAVKYRLALNSYPLELGISRYKIIRVDELEVDMHYEQGAK